MKTHFSTKQAMSKTAKLLAKMHKTFFTGSDNNGEFFIVVV